MGGANCGEPSREVGAAVVMQGVMASLLGVLSSFNQPAVLHVVDSSTRREGRAAERTGDRLLTLTGLPADQAQHPELGGDRSSALIRSANRAAACAPTWATRARSPGGVAATRSRSSLRYSR